MVDANRPVGARPQTAIRPRGNTHSPAPVERRCSSDTEDVALGVTEDPVYDIGGEENSCCGISTGGSHLTAASSSPVSSNFFRPAGLKCVNTLSGHHAGVRTITVHNERIFTGSYDNTIKVWNLDSATCEATLEGHTAWIRSLLTHGRDPLLFSGSDDGLIRVWRIDTFKLLHELRHESPQDQQQEPCGGILSLAMDHDRNWLLAGSYCATIFVWALPSYSLLHRLRGHRSAVRTLIVYNSCLLSGSYDRTVKLWDLGGDCKSLGSLGTKGSVWVLVVHDGLLIAAIGDSSIKVWRVDTWEQVATLSGHRGLVLALAVYHDRLISGSDDRCIRVWRLHTWECERILTGHNGGVVGICMVNGNLVSASNDSFIKVWNSSGIQRPFTSTGIRR
mmetsp:Transcript_36304/g.60122  ORF Transcript_36304/g.60122 Transcript_36304/m.60122 type:complete len:391 (+) Transcript_36304:153-1325(+)